MNRPFCLQLVRRKDQGYMSWCTCGRPVHDDRLCKFHHTLQAKKKAKFEERMRALDQLEEKFIADLKTLDQY